MSKDFGPCVAAAMTNGSMKYRNIFAELLGTVILSDIAEMNVMPLDLAINLSTFVCEVTGHVRMQHLKREDDCGFHQRKNLKWIKRQISNKLQKVFIGGRKEYLSEAESLELEEIKMCKSACYTPPREESRRKDESRSKKFYKINIYPFDSTGKLLGQMLLRGLRRTKLSSSVWWNQKSRIGMKWNEAICGTHKTLDYKIWVRI